MKKICCIIFFFACFVSGYSQNVGIGTSNPSTRLEIKGSFSVKTDYVSAISGPAPAQTFTMVNAGTVTMSQADSISRIYDPGGPAGNYNANLTADALVLRDITSNTFLELTIENIALGTGDSLFIYDGVNTASPLLYKWGNGFIATDLSVSFTNSAAYCVFKSNTDASTAAGFSLLFKRKYINPLVVDPKPAGGTGFVFYPREGALSSGKLRVTPPGTYSTAMGFQNMATGHSSFALGYQTQALGLASTTMGYDTKASGITSTAMGYITEASGNYSMAMGYQNKASANYSTAMGAYTKTSGMISVTMGSSTIAKSYASLAIGRYNDTLATESETDWLGTDRVFVIGDGTIGSRSSCFYILKNGNGWIQGTLTQASDARLKTGIIQLHDVLPKLLRLNGYHYYWKDNQNMPGLQAGLIAQEIQKEMPELVTTNTEGQLAINYNGMIPYLLEGIKTQQQEINFLKEQLSLLKKLVEQKMK